MLRQKCNIINKEKDNYVIIGDSHATDLYIMLKSAYSQDNFLRFAGAGCNPSRKTDICNLLYQDAFDLIVKNQKHIQGVIVSWISMDDQQIVELLDKININKVFFGGHPSLDLHLPEQLSKPFNSIDINQDMNCNIIDSYARADLNLKETLLSAGVKYYSKIDLFCNQGRCPCIRNGKLLTRDFRHYSPEGSKYFGQVLKGKFQKVDDLFWRGGDSL